MRVNAVPGYRESMSSAAASPPLRVADIVVLRAGEEVGELLPTGSQEEGSPEPEPSFAPEPNGEEAAALERVGATVQKNEAAVMRSARRDNAKLPRMVLAPLRGSLGGDEDDALV